MRPWTAAVKAARAYLKAGFNGATALRPWTVWHVSLETVFLAASMGPRPCGRGRGIGAAVVGVVRVLQWGHGLAAVDGLAAATIITLITSFNGATALRPWTAPRPDRACSALTGFNGGHGLAAVDGTWGRR